MRRDRELRVLVTEDSAVARQLLVRILDNDPGLRVVGEAPDGETAVRLARQLRPDVITMDVHMPGMSGVEATRGIMEDAPTPILIVTASTDRAATSHSFAALSAGALTVVEKPRGPASPEFGRQARALVETVKLMAEVKLVTRRTQRRPRPDPSPPAEAPEQIEVVAMAASTGGPAALATILGALPSDAPVPILVVQHITAGFEESLVEWLSDVSTNPVALASPGQPLRPGEVLVAPRGAHLGIDGNSSVALVAGPPIGSHRPSGSYLFRSVAEAFGRKALGVILTGMGNDGVQGLAELKRKGGWVLAQDEATSAVYGMPQEAVAMGVVDRILPVHDIPDAMVTLWRRGRELSPAPRDG